MDAERWARVQDLFHHAVTLPNDDRAAYLAAECGGDAQLVAEVTALLEEDSGHASLLDRDIGALATAVMTGSRQDALPRERFGPYRITRVLGEGGMGVVYLAEREDLGSLAAIKILRDAWLSPARRERFLSEQRTLAQLNHPSIARLFDADALADGTPWFVMEYVEGVPLTEYCREHASTIPERLRLVRSVCEAVQHAHRNLVIHRDLKPSNVLVRPDGSVKLVDFGIAKHLETVGSPVDQTRTALRLMTPAYAAPEQIRGEPVGVYTDIYALGVVLYELLVGRLPFDLSNLTPSEAESTIVERDPERPSTAARRMPLVATHTSHLRSVSHAAWADLDVLCLTAMHKDPQRRYASVEALVRDIDHFLRGEPLEARADTMRYRVGKFVRRNWRPLSASVGAVLMLMALVGFYTVRLRGARNAAVAEAARTQRIQDFMLTLFEGGDEAAGPAESLRVVTLVDRGIRDTRALDREPGVQAALLQTLGGISGKLGNLDRADTLLQASLAQRRKRYGNDNLETARSLEALAQLRTDQAKFDDAERFAREALRIATAASPNDVDEVATAKTTLGKVLEERGSYDEGIAVLGEAARLRSAESDGASTPELASSLRELANTHFYAGHFATADSLDRIVLGMTRALNGERHPLVAEDLINLGAVQHEWGHYPAAEQYFRQALEIVRAFYGEDHYKTAAALTMLGRSLVFEDRYDEAKASLERALAIRERVFGTVHPNVASTLNELGNIASRTKHYPEAAAYFQRMIAIYRQVYHGKHYLIGIATANLASVYLGEKEYTRAEPLFRDALAMYAQTLAPEHLNVGITRIKLGRTLFGERRYAEAERELTAGYDIVSRQTSPAVTWLQAARKDLAALYDSIGQPAKAERYRTELAAVGKK